MMFMQKHHSGIETNPFSIVKTGFQCESMFQFFANQPFISSPLWPAAHRFFSNPWTFPLPCAIIFPCAKEAQCSGHPPCPARPSNQCRPFHVIVPNGLRLYSAAFPMPFWRQRQKPAQPKTPQNPHDSPSSRLLADKTTHLKTCDANTCWRGNRIALSATTLCGGEGWGEVVQSF
jgi:hypothetical protein